jgi:predicted dehydrogenase
MLSDPELEAIVVAVADQFHVALAEQALDAGKHVIVEKPMGTTIEECVRLVKAVRRSGLKLQVGNNRRFDPGIAFARTFAQEELGGPLSLSAWYWDSAYRYTMTDNLQPILATSTNSLKPVGDPKSNPIRYYLLTHGSHLFDTMSFIGGEIDSVRARLLNRFGVYCWFIEVAFKNGSLGHLDMTIAVKGDFEEGFRVQGEAGSIALKSYLPWYHKAADVECFSAKTREYRRPLGEDAHTYKLQVEGFARAVLTDGSITGATADDGLATMRALVATARSCESGRWVNLADVVGAP